MNAKNLLEVKSIGVTLAVFLMASVVLPFEQAYSLISNSSEVVAGTNTNQNSSTINTIINQNFDGKLDAPVVPYSNATSVLKNGTIIIEGSRIPVSYEQIGQLKILDDDMLLASEIIDGRAAVDRFIKSKPWTNGIIPVVINSDISDSKNKSIAEALKYVQEVTPVSFKPVDLNTEGEIVDSNYLRFVSAPATDDRCYTFSGMLGRDDPIFTDADSHFYTDAKYHGQPVVVASWCDKGSLVHEIGHTLGLWHEQKRCDRDQFIEVIWSNIKERAKPQYYTLCDPSQPSKSPASLGTAYDYCSIMHYKRFSNFAIDKNQPVFRIKQEVTGCEEIKIGYAEVYSPTDIRAIKTVYSFVQ